MTAPFHDHALDLARQGWEVFPTAPRTKKPYAGSHGHRDATRDIGEVGVWISTKPKANIGLRPSEGVAVIDVDHVAPFREWLDQHDLALPATRTVRTGRGWHYYYRLPDLGGRPLIAGLPGVDIKTSNGFVLAPGSVASSGRIYRLVRDLPVADLPGEWADHLVRPVRKPRPQGAFRGPVEIQRGGQRLVRHFAIRAPGTGRRDYLRWCLQKTWEAYGGDSQTIDALCRVAVDIHGKDPGDVARLADWVAASAPTLSTSKETP